MRVGHFFGGVGAIVAVEAAVPVAVGGSIVAVCVGTLVAVGAGVLVGVSVGGVPHSVAGRMIGDELNSITHQYRACVMPPSSYLDIPTV